MKRHLLLGSVLVALISYATTAQATDFDIDNPSRDSAPMGLYGGLSADLVNPHEASISMNSFPGFIFTNVYLNLNADINLVGVNPNVTFIPAGNITPSYDIQPCCSTTVGPFGDFNFGEVNTPGLLIPNANSGVSFISFVIFNFGDNWVTSDDILGPNSEGISVAAQFARTSDFDIFEGSNTPPPPLPSSVPEPSSFILLAGLLGLGFTRRIFGPSERGKAI